MTERVLGPTGSPRRTCAGAPSLPVLALAALILCDRASAGSDRDCRGFRGLTTATADNAWPGMTRQSIGTTFVTRSYLDGTAPLYRPDAKDCLAARSSSGLDDAQERRPAYTGFARWDHEAGRQLPRNAANTGSDKATEQGRPQADATSRSQDCGRTGPAPTCSCALGAQLPADTRQLGVVRTSASSSIRGSTVRAPTRRPRPPVNTRTATLSVVTTSSGGAVAIPRA